MPRKLKSLLIIQWLFSLLMCAVVAAHAVDMKLITTMLLLSSFQLIIFLPWIFPRKTTTLQCADDSKELLLDRVEHAMRVYGVPENPNMSQWLAEERRALRCEQEGAQE